jgi:hypothetical protein
LVNGVPVRAENITTSGTCSIDAANTGPDGNVFQVTQAAISLTTFNSDAFNNDLLDFFDSFNTWVSDGQIGSVPDVSSYVKDSYTMTVGSNQVNTYTGKLIRVTTGSNLAIADMSYPLPTAHAVPGNPESFPVYDAPNNKYYAVSGSYNVINAAKIGTTNYTASGTYSTQMVGGSLVITASGTIIRADGSKFFF